jgi:pyruvate kinase
MKLKKLDREVTAIYEHLLQRDAWARKQAFGVHPNFEWSAINLMRYLVLRTHDLRKIHDALSEYGISSLRTGEGYVLRNVIDVLRLIKLLQGETWKHKKGLKLIGYEKSKKLRHLHTNNLFNPKDRQCFTEIMVTMPGEAANNEQLVDDLLLEGMEIARVNFSHDDKKIWTDLSKLIRKRSRELQTPCKILMDLGGPKVRTEQIIVERKGKLFGSDRIKIKNGDAILLLSENTDDLKEIAKKHDYQLVGITINLPSVLADLEIGDRVFFDDGKFGARVLEKNGKEVKLIIESGSKEGRWLKVQKGINLPDTKLKLASLTKDDIENLPFAVSHADIIGYSFVRSAEDVKFLFDLLGDHLTRLGIILKIENRQAFEDLPLILLEAMKCPNLGVMIARGDLAVEVGPERMSEIQDEIMWICEAAHIPVVWATEVLDKLAKEGRPTRSEITDAANSVRAECVMLNKGPYIVDAVKLLKSILIRMERHTSKKKSKMRPLKLAIEALKRINN